MLNGIAVVTGGASGIGRDCVLAYAVEGVRAVLVADIDDKKAQDVSEHSRSMATNPSYETMAFQLDVSSEQSVGELMDLAVKTYGRIDYLVNCAGIGVTRPAEIMSASVEEMDHFYSVNVRGTFLCLRACSRIMAGQTLKVVTGRNGLRDAGRGVIVNLASCNSFVATPNITQYTTSKHAVLGMTRNSALDNARHKVRVVAVCPSWVNTPMIAQAVQQDPAFKERIENAVPLGRIAEVEEVTDVVMFLSSHKASYITGVGWIVDGGTTSSLQI